MRSRRELLWKFAVPGVWVLADYAQGSDGAVQRRLENRFISPCCWSESVAVHRSPKAEEMRAEIARLLASGKTEDQIVEMYVAEFGERILLEPRGSRSLWLTAMPAGAAVLAGGWLVRYLSRRRAAAIADPVTRAAGPLPEVDDDW